MQSLTNYFFEYSNHLTAMLLAAILSSIISKVYIKYGNSVSNRKIFARNFLLVTMSTTFIIIIVKASIALSLGLVGALSIVRFRAAIKEPEEIAYLFLVIATGIGLGAFQFIATLVAVPVIILLIITRAHFVQQAPKSPQLGKYNIHIISQKAKDEGITPLISIVEQRAGKSRLKHFSEDEHSASLLFLSEIKDLNMLEDLRKSLQTFEPGVSVDILENRELG